MLKKFTEYFIKNSAVSNWIMLVIMIAGIYALFNLTKRNDPKFEIETISINTPYPGASAIEVEEGIVVKIEERLRGMEGVEKIRSWSSDGWGTVDVDIIPDYDMNKALQNVKNVVNSIGSYPMEAEKPIINQDTQWTRALLLSIYGTDDLVTLKKIVEEFRDELLATGVVSNINVWGVPTREFSVEVSPETLIRYKLTIGDIAQAVRNSNLNISSGSIVTDNQEILIRSYNKKYDSRELAKIEVVSSIDGQKILLGEICTVVEQWPENVFFPENKGHKAIGFAAMYNNNEDALVITETTEALAKKYEAKYNGLIHFDTFLKDTQYLEERLELMTENGILGLVLVIVILSIFLNVRMSFWVSLGIPISLLGMFFTLWTLGISINEYSLFGMIMVIGILVDDGIIIGESIYAQYEKYGKKPFQAAVDGTLEVIKPVTISILTTIVAFVPYFYFYGFLGKYVWQIAAVVIIALLFSLVEAMIILPTHLAHSKALEGKKTNDINFFSRLRARLDVAISYLINKLYGPFLKYCIRNRWAVLASVFAVVLIITGLFMGTHVRAQFFPEIEPPFARLEVEVHTGTSANVSDELRDRLVDKALEFGKEWQAERGMENTPIENHFSWMNGNSINIFFCLPTVDNRNFSISEFSNALSEYMGDVPEAENVICGGFSFGGSPISVRFSSHDYSQLMKAKDLLKKELQKIDGVKDIRDDTPLGNTEFVVSLKPKGKALGFTLRDLTTQLRQGFYGQEVMRLQKGRDEMKLWVRFKKEDRMAISQVENLKVRTPQGEFVPFKEVAEYRNQRSIRRIRHENGERAVTVYAEMDYSKNDLSVVLKELNSVVVPDILKKVDGVTRSYGGQSEEMGKIMGSVTYSMGIALLVMFTILMFLLKSYWQTIVIMSLIPLGVIGSVIGHYFLGIPINILSFLGIVALAGIIVNDSVVLVDKYNRLIAEGIDVKDALFEAGLSRFRPIILTTITTAAGLMPIITMTSVQGKFLVPMAVSVAFGLMFGTLLTLLALPSSLYAISDIRKFFNRKKSRPELEPAYKLK